LKQLEVCIENIEGALIASNAGATRLELSEHLDVGGVTPSLKLVSLVCEAVSVPVIVLVRSRSGDFVYDHSERVQMLESAHQILKRGAAGIAFGALADRGELHWDFMTEMIEIAKQNNACSVVHRAFDGVARPDESMERLIAVGCDRILTSGGPLAAYDGVKQLKRLVLRARGRIGILPAGGIHSGNAQELLEATGCTELHGSFRDKATSSRLPSSEEIRRVQDVLARQPFISGT
jgi:copper homeostasis protein